MKTFLKFIGILVVLILAIMVLLPFVFKGKLEQIAKKEINKNVNARVDFSGASLSLFRSFPDFNLNMEGLQVIGKQEFMGDTLVKMDALSIDIDLFSVFRGAPYEIKKIALDKPDIKLIVLPDGTVNYDIMISEPELPEADTAEAITLSINKILIRNGKLLYEDRSLNFNLFLDDLEGSLNGDFSADLADIQTDFSANTLDMTYEEIDYLSKVKTEFKSLVAADFKNSTYTLTNTEAVLNDLLIGFEGVFVLGEEDVDMDFSFKSKDSNFKSLLSLIPVLYSRQFEQLKSDGAFAFEGKVKGIYNETTVPAFAVDLKVDNATVRYPDLPKNIAEIFITLMVKNTSGILDETLIDLSRFSMTMAGNPLSGKLLLKTPVSDPDFDAVLKGKVDLGSLADVVPLKEDESLKGILDFDLSLKAKMSDIKSKSYDQIAANGTLTAHELQFISSMLSLPIEVKMAALAFSPASIELSQLDMQVGKSDFKGSGKLGDFLPYYLSDEELKGELVLISELIDVNELMAGMATDTNAKVADTANQSLNLPKRVDFSLFADAKKLIWENYELDQVNANINLKDQVISFNPLKANLMGGTVQMEGNLDGTDMDLHPFDFNFSIASFDIFQAYQTIGLFQKAVPIAEKTKGHFSTGLHLKGKMKDGFELAYETLLGGGILQTTQIFIESVPAMQELANLLGNDKYSRLVTDGLNFSYEILNGKVYQKPIMIKYADTDVTIGGNVGFDQTLDYNLNLQIPYNALGSGVQSGIAKLISAGANAGIPLDLGTSVNVKAKITGMVSDPKISLDYQDFLSDRKADITNMVTEELNKQKEELTGKAKAEAEKLLGEAKKQGDALIAEAELAAKKVHDEAVKAADLVRNQANIQSEKMLVEANKMGAIAGIAAKEAAKQVKIEGESSADQLVQEADKKAADIVNLARKQADDLLLQAQKKADESIKL